MIGEGNDGTSLQDIMLEEKPELMRFLVETSRGIDEFCVDGAWLYMDGDLNHSWHTKLWGQKDEAEEIKEETPAMKMVRESQEATKIYRAWVAISLCGKAGTSKAVVTQNVDEVSKQWQHHAKETGMKFGFRTEGNDRGDSKGTQLVMQTASTRQFVESILSAGLTVSHNDSKGLQAALIKEASELAEKLGAASAK